MSGCNDNSKEPYGSSETNQLLKWFPEKIHTLKSLTKLEKETFKGSRMDHTSKELEDERSKFLSLDNVD